MADTEQQQAQELYDKLKPEAQAVYIDHIVSRTPPPLQDEMKAIAQDDLGGAEPDPTVAMVTNGQQVVVTDVASQAAPGSPGSAIVSNGTLTGVQLAAAPPLRQGQEQSGIRSGPIPQRQTAPPKR